MTELWTGKIYARDGFTRTNVLGATVALDIGCGNRRLPGARGVDILSLPAVDVVHDLARFPWPFADSSIDLVLANHFLEHSEDVVRTMEEVYRILSPGGRFVIQVPYFRSVDAINDPTHRRFFSSQSLDYFIEGSKLFDYHYANACFARRGFCYGWPHPSKNPLKRFGKALITRHPHFYDQYLSLLFPMKCLTWELEAVKTEI